MIVSYEMLLRYVSDVRSIKFDLIICDEAHRLKNFGIKTTAVSRFSSFEENKYHRSMSCLSSPSFGYKSCCYQKYQKLKLLEYIASRR